ncbi:MAG: hypothetical protein CL908_03380 [Deltaproteobacteria bacterium]|jgi:hypothetical protein|nr:hypothetical protein [Deltaproteobacteria bacterium]
MLPGFFALFLIAVAAAAWRSIRSGSWPMDLLLPGYAVFALAALSVLNGSPFARYMHPLVPFVFLILAREVYALAERIPARLDWKGVGAVLALSVMILWVNPGGSPTRLARLRLEGNCSVGGDGVFSSDKEGSYAVGGVHRTLPDAEFEALREYARRTETRWLVVSSSRRSLRELEARESLGWLRHSRPEVEYSGRLERVCPILGGTPRRHVAVLYRFVW